MYKISNFSFAEWFYTEANTAWYQAGLSNLAAYKHQIIDPEIDKILAYGEAHPEFMSEEQKAELQNIRQDQEAISLYKAYKYNRPRQKLGLGMDLADPNKVKTNIARMTSRFPLNTFKTLDELLAAVNNYKKNNGGEIPVATIAQMINYLTTDRIILAIENAERQAKTGGATPSGDSEGGEVDVDKAVVDADEEANVSVEQADFLNKLDDCMREYQKAKSDKFTENAKKKLREIESKIDGKGKITWQDFLNAKKYALYSILGRFINEEYTTQDTKGLPSKNRLLDKQAMAKFRQSSFNSLNPIIQSEKFKQFLQDDMNSQQPTEDVQLLQLATIMTDALLALSQKPADVKMDSVLEPYKQSSFVSSNPGLGEYLDRLKDIVINDKLAQKGTKTRTAVGPSNLDQIALDTMHPTQDPKNVVEGDFLDFQKLYNAVMENPKKMQELLVLGKDKDGQIIRLDLTQSCEEMMNAFRKAGRI